MAANNYFGFTHGGTQYSATTGGAYQTGQPGYAVATPAAAAATYGTQRAGYDPAYQAAAAAAASQGTYAAVGAGPTQAYEYGYGQPATAGYTTGYDQNAAAAAAAAAKPASYPTTYTQRPQQTAQVVTAAKAQYIPSYQANPAGYQATYAQPIVQNSPHVTTQAKRYDAALYSAASMYVAQQSVVGGAVAQKAVAGAAGWQYKKGGIGGKNVRAKQPPKPQQLHYCDVCKISCAGPQTYKEHLEGQKHKKREAATKMSASVAVTTQNRAGNSLRCQLCDVTCTGNDAYAAHIRGAKHQKVVLLHTKLGKPIPTQEPEVIGGPKKSIATTPKINFVPSGGLGVTAGNGGDFIKEEEEDIPEPDIQPVGQDYIDEIKGEDGKVMSFNCKLCDCRFNDPNAKEMHMKGRRHRLQYKKKVNPELVVDVKPSLRQRKIQEEKMRRAALREEFWARRHYPDNEEVYWNRGYGDDYGHGNMDPFLRGRPYPGPPTPFFQGGVATPPRRTESSDDKHVMARHSEIYPKNDELQAIQAIVSHTEKALKIVSDRMNDVGKAKDVKGVAAPKGDIEQPKEDGRDNQLFSFQQDSDANPRTLKGVMRVGHLAKGLLLCSDSNVELVVLCADKPSLSLLKKVVEFLPAALKQVAADRSYTVAINAPEAGLVIAGDGLTVLVQFTSPVIREQQEAASGGFDRDVLSRGKCLQALAALRHTKWFQARVLGLHSCVIVIRILRDLCQRVPTWSPLTSWAMELLAEKVISSVPNQAQLSPGDALRRVMEAVASGLLLPGGPGLADPCEKDNPDAAATLNAQQREDLTCSAQYALRLIAYRQIHKVLGMDPLPGPQKLFKKDRFGRKRRLSGSVQDGIGDDNGKMVKTEGT